MKNRIIAPVLLLASGLVCDAHVSESDGSAEGSVPFSPSEYVNTLTGTMSDYSLSTGNTYPAIAVPWGMNFFTPQTGRMGDGWAYTYQSRKIRGFKQTHQPSPWINDYGQFSIMPVTGRTEYDENRRASWFSHRAEEARPYYYSVYLAEHDVKTEIAPADRSAMIRFTFPENDSSSVVIDAFDGGSEIVFIPSENKIKGYTTKNSGGVPGNFRNYFVIAFDRPVDYFMAVSDSVLSHGTVRASGNHALGIAGFKTRRGDMLNVRIASSFISHEQAELNLRELSGDFDTVKLAAKRQWDEMLGRIRIDDHDTGRVRTFYSCLYRSLLFPRKLYEINANGETVHYSPYSGRIEPGYMYTDTGFWDTFRALFPLLNLLYPEENEKIQAGLVNAYKESGFLPEWASPGHRGCMVGNNSASVVADAVLSGLDNYDKETLWEAVTHGAHAVHPQVSSTGRLGWELYNDLGYVPCDKGIYESAARTLEYAYDDWCIWRMGAALGKSAQETEPYRLRAMNYKNLFDKNLDLMRGRNADGTWQTPFNPLKWGDSFTEGNSWHYTWSVFHDPAGLISLMGGEKRFNMMLDSVMSQPPLYDESYYGQVIHEIREMQVMNMGNYAHGNQPVQHILYLYNWSGEPWKTQYWTREVCDRLYSATPDGYCGDEDNGQTSAWYVFSAMGFYPVCPGSGEYAIGSPIFKKISLEMPSGKSLEINAPSTSSYNRYIGAVKLNGMPYGKNYFTRDILLDGGCIVFDMRSVPDTKRGTAADERPYSFSLIEDFQGVGH